MATERTVLTPTGEVITVDTVDQTVMTPSGAVVNATIEAAAAGGNEPLFYHHQRMLSRCS